MKDLNLIPKSYILQKKNRVKRLKIAAVGTLLFALVVCSIVVPLLNTYSLTQQRNLLDMKIKAGSGYALTLNQLTQIKNLYKEREDESAKIVNNHNKLSDLMNQIEKSSPNKNFIVDFSYNGGKVNGEDRLSIIGGAASENEIASFISYLRRIPIISDVTLNSVKKVETKNLKSTGEAYYDFTLTIYIKGQDVVK